MERKVLLVDDEPFIRSVIKRFLRQEENLVFLEAGNGQEALEMIHSGGIDVVILDVMMPVMTGVEVLEALEAEGNNTPVIVVTGGITDANINKRLEDLIRRGRTVKLEKPFDNAKIRELVRAITSK